MRPPSYFEQTIRIYFGRRIRNDADFARRVVASLTGVFWIRPDGVGDAFSDAAAAKVVNDIRHDAGVAPVRRRSKTKIDPVVAGVLFAAGWRWSDNAAADAKFDQSGLMDF